jgi:hypothetical protein
LREHKAPILSHDLKYPGQAPDLLAI